MKMYKDVTQISIHGSTTDGLVSYSYTVHGVCVNCIKLKLKAHASLSVHIKRPHFHYSSHLTQYSLNVHTVFKHNAHASFVNTKCSCFLMLTCSLSAHTSLVHTAQIKPHWLTGCKTPVYLLTSHSTFTLLLVLTPYLFSWNIYAHWVLTPHLLTLNTYTSFRACLALTSPLVLTFHVDTSATACI